MALSFLRHLKPENLKSRKKFPATQTPLQSDTAQRQLKDESPADDSISDQFLVVDGQRAEEDESGICMDTSSEHSRRESNESQEVSSLSTIEDLEDGQKAPTEVPVDDYTILPEGQLEDAVSDISVYDAHEFPAGAEEESQNEIRSSYVADDAESLEHPSESLEHPSGSLQPPLKSLEHDSGESLQYSEVHMTDNFDCSSPTSFLQESEELVSEPETSSLTMPTLSSSTYQHADDTADDTESYLSITSRQNPVTEPGAFSNSQSPRLSNASQDSSEISLNIIAEFSPLPPVLPPPAPPPPPPPPPPLSLFLPGDHTTSSTTDFQPTSTSVSTQKTRSAAAANRAEGTDDELMQQIQAAARKMSNQRETLSHLDQGFPNVKPKQLPESFTSNLKSVIASRQSRIGSAQMEGGEIPGKITYYKSRIGIPPEDTELCRVFLKRAAKATPENAPDYGFAGEKTAACQEVMSTGAKAPPIMTSDSRKSSEGDVKQFKVSNSDENNFEPSVADEITEQSAFEDVSACAVGTYEYEDTYRDTEDKQQNVTEVMSWQNESDDIADNFHSTMVQNSDFEQDTQASPSSEPEEKEFDKVVEDFDQFLEENVSANSWQDPSDIPFHLQGQTQISPVPDPKDGDDEFRNGDTGSSEPAYTNGMSENSSSLSPNLSTFSDAESPVFEEMDEVAISKSAQTVKEHSKLLAQPLESYNILPTIQEISTKNEPKSKFSFRNIMASLRNTLGRRKQNYTESKRFSLGDGSQMKFDDNWSIHDTLTRGPTLEDHKNKSRSLKDVFNDYEVRSFSEFTDPDQNSGKDFSVRNWKEVMERSKDDVKNTPDQGNPETATETAGLTGLPTKRASSSPNLGTPSDTGSKYSSPMEKPHFSAFSAKSSRAVKKPKSSNSKDDLEELTSNTSVESPSRHSSSGLNSTLPSRRLHGMMQSFDSIYPGAPSFDQRHYQKKAEPRKFSLPNKGTAGLLSPVQRRKQRSQQAKQ